MHVIHLYRVSHQKILLIGVSPTDGHIDLSISIWITLVTLILLVKNVQVLVRKESKISCPWLHFKLMMNHDVLISAVVKFVNLAVQWVDLFV